MTKELTTKIFELKGGPAPRLIRAKTAQGAVAFATKATFTAAIPSQDRLLELRDGGVKVESAESADATGSVP